MDVSPIEVQKHLRGIDYPAAKADVIGTAEQNGAPQEIIEALQQVDELQFAGPDDVQRALA